MPGLAQLCLTLIKYWRFSWAPLPSVTPRSLTTRWNVEHSHPHSQFPREEMEENSNRWGLCASYVREERTLRRGGLPFRHSDSLRSRHTISKEETHNCSSASTYRSAGWYEAIPREGKWKFSLWTAPAGRTALALDQHSPHFIRSP